MIVRENEILQKMNLSGNQDAVDEKTMNAIISTIGIDFSKTVRLRGESPNREWTNNEIDFVRTPHRTRVVVAKAEINNQEQIELLKAQNEEVMRQMAALLKAQEESKVAQEEGKKAKSPKVPE